ncbi:MAG: class I SAM-dependent methyltransferase [Gammaproteobacteria bacterium]|nr:class I SAM-dependent methyltransferase [Gammaproteobacteria bacterium]NNJ84223.1 class I SAM-dependent methyltransferase [Gammaproteobacteria bacterium]
MAEAKDRHALYQQAVQCVEAEIDFVDDTFKTLRGRWASSLREDFCGTASTACEWVRRRPTNHAVGVDIDADVQDWGRKHNVVKLDPDARQRILLQLADVRTVRTAPMDAILAMNFSCWLFTERKVLKEYFRHVRNGLSEDGVFFLDAYGGYECCKVIQDRNECDGFTYIWDQATYNPINGEMTCFIHFEFPDGSRLDSAFRYDWRLWTLPEILEILEESGFRRTIVYWQGTDEETGEGNGVFTPETQGEPDPAWIAYITAER